MNEELEKEIDKLIEKSKEEDPTLASILLIVKGADVAGDLFFLAKHMHDFTQEVLLPRVKQKRDNFKAGLN